MYKLAKTNSLTMQNLLVNGDFQINQRGKNDYSITNKDLYTLDMWRIIASSTTTKLTTLNSGVKLQNMETGSSVLTQRINISKVSDYTIVLKVDNIIGNVIVEIYYMENGYEKHTLKDGINIIKVQNNSIRDISPTIVGEGSIDIEYIDLFEGTVPYQHVKEDYALALLRCKQWVQMITKSSPIRYEYGSSKYTYLITIEYDKMNSLPTIESQTYTYIREDGYNASGNNGTYSIGNQYITFTTGELDRVSSLCKAINTDLLLTCEPR